MLNQIADRIASELELAAENNNSLFVEFKPGFFAYASQSEDGGSGISYHQGEMPEYQTESFSNLNDCVKEMVKVSADWQMTENEEE